MSRVAARELDRLGYADSPVHRLDARAKLLVAAALVLAVSSFPRYEVAGLLPFFAVPVALGLGGRVAPRPVLRLVLAASPFALLVGLANPFLDTAPAAHVAGVAVRGGVLSLLSILLRFALCTSTLLLLVATTSMPRLVRGLRLLGTPAALTTQLQFLYRYLFLLVAEGERLQAARLLREPRRRLPRLATARGMLFTLLRRTWDRGERVYRCMQVRGFQGELPSLATERFRARDAAFLALGVTFCAAARLLPLSRWAGEALLSRLS
ncbi:energy-coupling factor transporter transmembrane component T family protein [Anaeromyxobacter paludicola]|uniref:Cobalt ECF transporter T component CbiQ n=1 Tax=Anaeromyxobacter paludicola TaxID=2918171 RepID=A0ABM7XDN8_9BACT|nr:energy-coupling factor transporter transmembrane component T [Anaeromyxobacter paludicola]BDG09978.1 cobalt ECF transporter T component CbiQ [Anaeromyxobacter paludicola]